MTLDEARIKEKLQEIVNKWKDKPEQNDTTTEHANRTIDRMRFRTLKKDLAKLQFGKTEGDSLFEYAEKLFGVE